VIFSHAERLASLVEGTPAYAQCVKLIARDIEDYAMTTPENARRIMANYTDAERIAVIHVFGSCGMRDPIKIYYCTVSLSSLPADDWLRAKSTFVAEIGALGSVTLLARIGYPLLPKRLGELDPPTHGPVQVPLASLFNLVEVLFPDDAVDRCSHCRDLRRRRRRGHPIATETSKTPRGRRPAAASGRSGARMRIRAIEWTR
jgi:hypothetical protein